MKVRSFVRSLAAAGILAIVATSTTAALGSRAGATATDADSQDFASDANSGGAVFVGTNHNNTSDDTEPANQIAYYRRAADGRLSLVGKYDTGGQGSGPSQRFAGDGLGAGNSITLSQNKKWLAVTNAGSNTVSIFRVRKDGLERTDVEPTGDGSQGHRFPNSVTIHDDTVYVLNSADQGSITGFTLSSKGRLTPIPGSTRMIDGNQGRFAPDPLLNPTQVSFTPDGSKLVVSIKDGPKAGIIDGVTPTGPGRVLVWDVRDNKPSTDFVRTDFDNRGPFGFSFDRKGNLIVGEFIGGGIEKVNGADTLTGAVGSYRIEASGKLTPITPGVKNHQLDTCWAVNNGRYAFGSNYTSGTISSYTVAADGSLTLLRADAGLTDHPANVQGSTPLDLGISADGRYLYNVLPGSGKVAGWRINDDGSLTKVGEFAGLPHTADGDQAAYDFSAGGSPAGIAVI